VACSLQTQSTDLLVTKQYVDRLIEAVKETQPNLPNGVPDPCQYDLSRDVAGLTEIQSAYNKLFSICAPGK